MEHSIKCSKISLNQIVCHVELIPENENERRIIQDVIAVKATEEERSKINNYLSQCILQKGYSPINLIKTTGRIFEFSCTK